MYHKRRCNRTRKNEYIKREGKRGSCGSLEPSLFLFQAVSAQPAKMESILLYIELLIQHNRKEVKCNSVKSCKYNDMEVMKMAENAMFSTLVVVCSLN